MPRTVVINVVGLTPALLGEHTPHLSAFANTGRRASIDTMVPAVTCSVQSTYLTGVSPAEHGVVANGWYFRDLSEVKFWSQSNALVDAPKIWDTVRAQSPGFTCANFFWWFNMYAAVDTAVTPRPMYPADGRKLPDIHTHPAALRGTLQERLGPFPLFKFWGPATSIASSTWIADAAIQTDRDTPSDLTLIYLPHLDYNLQRLGPGDPAIADDLRDVDAECGKLIDHFTQAGARVIVLSEYGIQKVSQPVHLNRVLRDAGLITLREELGLEYLDAGASAAFAVADHQIAHVYVNASENLSTVKALLEGQPGVARVLDEDAKRAAGLHHARSGELIVLAEPQAWFTYYFWQDDTRAPDYARTVDIHRKPGYDPVELLLCQPEWRAKARIIRRLAQKKLGFRTLLDVIPLEATRIKGSHGVAPISDDEHPLLITQQSDLLQSDSIKATDVHNVILRHLA